ncbi:MAG: bacteriohemerythrin [Prochlorotrichaceae cyanobacterium]
MDFSIAQWRSQYETGDPIVDSQHQNLFSMINGLHQAMLEGQGEDLLEKTLDGLQDYTAIHFETEEQFMLKHHYPNYEVHKEKHDAFKGRVADLCHTYTQGVNRDLVQLTREVSHLLTHWFIHHIKDEDQKMISFCTGEQRSLNGPKEEQHKPQSEENTSHAKTLAQWNARYETGYVLIDDQHKALFHAINALHEAILLGRSTEDLIQRTLKSLHNYTTIHFETEEQFMLKTGYPDYEAHRKKHHHLREKVESLSQLQKTTDSHQFSITMSHFLTDWLIKHINAEDQKMINFLREERATHF